MAEAKFDLVHDLKDASLLVLFKGVVRQHVLLDAGVTTPALEAAVFSDSKMPPAKRSALTKCFSILLCGAAKQDW